MNEPNYRDPLNPGNLGLIARNFRLLSDYMKDFGFTVADIHPHFLRMLIDHGDGTFSTTHGEKLPGMRGPLTEEEVTGLQEIYNRWNQDFLNG